MPLWVIYHTEDTLAGDEAKAALARDITAHYTNIGLPAFYVVVNFVRLGGGDMYVGGEARAGGRPFVRISIDHAAVRLADDDGGAEHRRVAGEFDALLRPHVADRGWRCEFHVNQVELRLWHIDGYAAPAHGSEAEKLWFRENRAVPFE